MGNDMNKVLPGLFVGNYRDSKDAGQLERHKISHIIAIHDAARRLHTDKEYLCITASDNPYQNLAQYFPACNDFIHDARVEGGNVLIHCLAGMSRSVTIVIAYIMSITSLKWNEALKVVRGARAVSNPNSGFQKQLQDFEGTKLSEERRRLLEKFGEEGTDQFEHDEETCRRLLIAYNHLLLSKAICEGRCASARVCPTGTCRAHCPASPSRLSRQKSKESSAVSSPRGSTKSLDTAGGSSGGSTSSGLGSEPPSSPRNWERHYGCWRNHHAARGSSLTCSSTPASPLLYRAASSKAPQTHRSDSMLSIDSISSVISLPAHVALSESTNNDHHYHPHGRGGLGPQQRRLLLERNPSLGTQSCPNSPKRMPRRVGSVDSVGNMSRTASVKEPSKSSAKTTTTAGPTGSLGVGGSGKQSSTEDVTRLIVREMRNSSTVMSSQHVAFSTLSLPTVARIEELEILNLVSPPPTTTAASFSTFSLASTSSCPPTTTSTTTNSSPLPTPHRPHGRGHGRSSGAAAGGSSNRTTWGAAQASATPCHRYLAHTAAHANNSHASSHASTSASAPALATTSSSSANTSSSSSSGPLAGGSSGKNSPNPNAVKAAKSNSTSNTIRVASGITKWVMKRSAYKFCMDKS